MSDNPSSPAFAAQRSRKPSKPPRIYRQLIALVVLVAIAGVLYLILPGFLARHLPNDAKGGGSIAEPSGDKVAEHAAYVALSKRNYLLVPERVAPQSSDYQITSINFCDKPVG